MWPLYALVSVFGCVRSRAGSAIRSDLRFGWASFRTAETESSSETPSAVCNIEQRLSEFLLHKCSGRCMRRRVSQKSDSHFPLLPQRQRFLHDSVQHQLSASWALIVVRSSTQSHHFACSCLTLWIDSVISPSIFSPPHFFDQVIEASKRLGSREI